MSEDLDDAIIASLYCSISVCLSWDLQKEKAGGEGRGEQGQEQEPFFNAY